MRMIDAMAYRKVLDEEMDNLLENTKNSIKYRLGIEVAIADLGDMPTIDAVPVVHGEWEKSQYNGYLVCSACRDVYVDNDWVDGKKWNYCPNCGAKMDGKQATSDKTSDKDGDE